MTTNFSHQAVERYDKELSRLARMILRLALQLAAQDGSDAVEERHIIEAVEHMATIEHELTEARRCQ